ncbi:glycosyltransferase family 2 protein [Blastococcus sp. SYSU D00695]
MAPAAAGPVLPGPRPTFSVVVSAWQAAPLIGTALRSVLAQTEPPHEVVVVDDGSTDDLAAALEPFRDAVRSIRIEHSGLATARNVSVAAATGDYVAILDADDWWEPQRLQRLGDLVAARPDLELVTTDAWFVRDGERRGRFYDVNPFPTVAQDTEILRANFFFAHVAVARETWHRFGGMSADVPWAEDWDFWLRLLVGGCRAGCVLEPLAGYRIHGGSVSADRWRSLAARVHVLDRAEAAGGLTPEQHRVLSAARAGHRRRAALARAERALLDGEPDRRRACLDLVRLPGVPARQRALAAAAAALPGLAGARLRRDAAAVGRAHTDRAHPRAGS